MNGDPESEEDPTMVFQKTLQQNLGNHDFEIALREVSLKNAVDLTTY